MAPKVGTFLYPLEIQSLVFTHPGGHFLPVPSEVNTEHVNKDQGLAPAASCAHVQ